MLLTEMFLSIQGEGPYTGIPMFFVRTNRCNLRCKWCDSAYTFTGGTEYSLAAIYSEVEDAGADWVCFTGGEPLLQRDALEFVSGLASKGKKILLETGGSLPIKEYARIPAVHVDMDVKTPSSGESESLYEENLNMLRKQDYAKFVISDPADYNYAKAFLSRLPAEVPVIFQPAWGSDLKWLADSVLNDRLKVRVMTQLHKYIWGNVPGK